MKITNKHLLIIVFLFLNCLNAPRDNRYDPQNPHKAEIIGTVYEPDSASITGAILQLYDDNNQIVQVDTSDTQGKFVFLNINPGVYKITGQTKYYSKVEIEAESLWAGTVLDSYNILFTTFHFEDDLPNEMPYGFYRISGTWRVVSDSSANHSIPNVYNGCNTDAGDWAITFFRSPSQALEFSLKMKVLSSSGNDWETGILLWYQDRRNYYFIRIRQGYSTYGVMKDSVETIFYTKPLDFTTDTWHHLKAKRCGYALPVYIDEFFQFPISLVNLEFSSGYWGLYLLNHQVGFTTSINCDDIYLRNISF